MVSIRTAWILVGLVGVSTSVLVAQRGPAGPPPLVKLGATQPVSDHVYVILDDNVGFVPNVGIIVGDRATLVVDTGLGPRNGRIIMDEVESVTSEVGRVRSSDELYVVSTHFHPEHALGEAGFPRDATIVRARAQQEDIDEYGLNLANVFAGFSPINAELLEGVEFRDADIEFDQETTLDLGGVRARIFWHGPTHTRGDTMVFVEEDGVLFAGDVVMNRRFLSFNSDYSSLRAWLESLSRLDKLGATTVVPSHGAMGDGTLIEMNRGYLAAIQARVTALKGEGRTLEEITERVRAEVQSMYADWTGGGNAVSGAVAIAFAEAD